MEVTTYIRELENAFCTETLRGWENSLAEIRRTPKGHLVSISGYVLWFALLVITSAVAINGGF